MRIKRIIAILFTMAALAALMTVTACAQSWWNDASVSVGVYPGSPTLPAGDVDRNGTVSAADARQALRFAVHLDQHLSEYFLDADYDGNGKVTSADARRILRCAVGLEGKTVPQADDGAYRIRVSSMYDRFSQLGALAALETNADLVTDSRDGSLPLWRLRSVADVDAFCSAYRKAGLGSFYDIEVPTFLKRYDESFFADRELFICYTVESSGDNLQAVYSPGVIRNGTSVAHYPLPDMSVYPSLAKGGTLTFSVGSVYPAGVTCDIGDWFLFLPVEKIAADGCISFDCVRGPGGVLPHDEYLAARKGLTKMMYASEQILPGSAEIRLPRGGETAFSFINAADGGYLWYYASDANIRDYSELLTAEDENCDLWLKEEHVGIPHVNIGSPGLQLYTVIAVKPGTYTLRFKLKRSWETEAIEERSITLIVSEGNQY